MSATDGIPLKKSPRAQADGRFFAIDRDVEKALVVVECLNEFGDPIVG